MTTYERPFGRYYEDFEPGDVYKHWPGKTITEADDHLFCMITMNHHPTHTNNWFAEHETPMGKPLVVGNLVYSLVLGMSVPDVSGAAIANLEVETLLHRKPTFHGDTIYAETQTQFGKNVVVGNLVYSLVLGMSVPDVSGACIANLEIETLQHKKPTFHGDTIYAETRVLEKVESKSKEDRGVVGVETFGFNQRGEEVCYFRRKLLVYKRAFAPPRQRPYTTE